MSEFITRVEYEEYKTRMHDEHNRQNNRIKELENIYKQQGELIGSIKEIAVTQKGMLEVQQRHTEQLDALEQIPAEKWNKLTVGIISAAAGAIGSGLIAAVINFIK